MDFEEFHKEEQKLYDNLMIEIDSLHNKLLKEIR
jgi:hypothetical protein